MKITARILFYTVMLILSSCEPVTEYKMVQQDNTTNELIQLLQDEIDDSSITEETIEMSDVIEETIGEVLPEAIKTYGNYITMNNKVMGIEGKKFIDIPDIKGLFKIDDILFYEIGDKKYSQDDKVVTEIEDSDYPSIPDSEYLQFKSSQYKVVPDSYKGTDISKVYQNTENSAYMQVDSALIVDSDLWFSVSIGIATREVGLYCWASGGNIQRKFESGRIW